MAKLLFDATVTEPKSFWCSTVTRNEHKRPIYSIAFCNNTFVWI